MLSQTSLRQNFKTGLFLDVLRLKNQNIHLSTTRSNCRAGRDITEKQKFGLLRYNLTWCILPYWGLLLSGCSKCQVIYLSSVCVILAHPISSSVSSITVKATPLGVCPLQPPCPPPGETTPLAYRFVSPLCRSPGVRTLRDREQVGLVLQKIRDWIPPDLI